MEQVEYLCKMLKAKFHLHNVATSFTVSVNTINSCKNQLLLKMTKSHNVFERLLSLYLGISSNNAQACARSIEQTPIKLFEHVWKFSTVLTRHNAVCDTKSVHVCIQWFQTLFLHIICNEHSCVFHQLCNIRCLSTWSSRHVKNSFIWLRSKSHHR